MRNHLFGLCLSLASLAGCGASPAPAPATPGADAEHGEHAEHAGHGEHGEHGGHHGKKHAFQGGMKDFHDVLAPAYHHDKGAQRDELACSGAPKMKEAAAKIAGEPKGDAAAWKAKADALAAGVVAMESACGAAGRADVAAKLETVHDAFHALMHQAKHAR